MRRRPSTTRRRGGRRGEYGPRHIVRLAAYHRLPAFHFKHGKNCLCGRFVLVNPHLKGWPDVVVTLPGGRLLWIEWKGAVAAGTRKTAESGLSPAQRLAIAELRQMGHEVMVTGNMDQVQDRFERESRNANVRPAAAPPAGRRSRA